MANQRDFTRASSPGPRSPGPGGRTKSPGPGYANSRVTYGLHEKVVRVTVGDTVREARQFVEENYKRDTLGLRGSPWDTSVQRDNQRVTKFNHLASDEKLSNTLRPENIATTDFVRRSGKSASTFQPFHHSYRPAAFDRWCTAEWGSSAHQWNASTAGDDPMEMRKRLEDFTARSKTATMTRGAKLLSPKERGGSAGRYIGPVERQQRRMEEIREQKKNEGVDYVDLAKQYGTEGADAMLHIIELKKRREELGLSPSASALPRRVAPMSRKSRGPGADVKAVMALGGLGDSSEDEGQQLKTSNLVGKDMSTTETQALQQEIEQPTEQQGEEQEVEEGSA